MISRVLAGRVLIAIGVLGVLGGIAGIVLGQLLLTSADQALSRSLVLTGETLDALQDAIVVAERTVNLVEEGLAQAETTTEDLAGTVADGADLLRSTADLTEDRLAGSLEAFESSLPGLIQVAGVIDTTLGALSSIPFGPTYDPDQPFDESLRELQESLAGVPDDLRAQAQLLRESGDNLDEVGEGTSAIAEDVGEIRSGLSDALDVLAESTTTAESAAELVGDTQLDLQVQMGFARALVILLGLATVLAQLVPLALGWTLLRPDARPLLRDDVARPPRTSDTAR